MQSKIKQTLYYPIGLYKTFVQTAHLKCSQYSGKRIILLNVPTHGNLGDHLLSIASQEFFRENFPTHKILCVTSSQLYFSIRISLRDVIESDILCIAPGGFLGSLYEEENRILNIIRRFPKNKIIILPQSYYYENTSLGMEKKSKAREVYQRHSQLYVTVREQKSYDILIKDIMKGKEERVWLLPDMALYLKRKQSTLERNGVLWCMRNDSEKNIANSSIIAELKKQIELLGLQQSYTDTYVNYSIPLDCEEKEVEKKIKDFQSAKIVITDRLHGMIYAYLTGTPCIVLDNVSGKVSHVYDLWLYNVPYIKFVADSSNTMEAIKELCGYKEKDFDTITLMEKFEELRKIIGYDEKI